MVTALGDLAGLGRMGHDLPSKLSPLSPQLSFKQEMEITQPSQTSPGFYLQEAGIFREQQASVNPALLPRIR